MTSSAKATIEIVNELGLHARAATMLVQLASTFHSDLFIGKDGTEMAEQLPTEKLESRYYIRVSVIDKPGVFAQLARILGDYGISISSDQQKELPEDNDSTGVPVVITTHTANEGNVRNALADIDGLDVCVAPSVCINIIDEHEELI